MAQLSERRSAGRRPVATRQPAGMPAFLRSIAVAENLVALPHDVAHFIRSGFGRRTESGGVRRRVRGGVTSPSVIQRERASRSRVCSGAGPIHAELDPRLHRAWRAQRRRCSLDGYRRTRHRHVRPARHVANFIGARLLGCRDLPRAPGASRSLPCRPAQPSRH